MLLVTVMLEVMSIQSFNSERNIDKLLPPDILSTEARYVQKCWLAGKITCLWILELFQEQLSQLVEIERSLVVFVMATYGEGDPTDNAQEFYDFLQEGLTQLDGIRYAVCRPLTAVSTVCHIIWADQACRKDIIILLKDIIWTLIGGQCDTRYY